MHKLKFFILLSAFLFSALLSACTDYAQKIEDEYGPAKEEGKDSGKDPLSAYMVDERDGHEYRTFLIGEQIWMAENLNYDSQESFCYGDIDQNCYEYGRLYTYNAALKACPAYWHLPTAEEIEVLIKNVGGYSTAANALKSIDGWDDNGNGSDIVGFAALPAGMLGYEGYYDGKGLTAGFWSSTEGDNDTLANYLIMRSDYEEARLNQGSRNYGYSIRCLYGEVIRSSSSAEPNSSSQRSYEYSFGEFFDNRDSRTYKTIEIGSQTWMAENLRFEMEDSYCYNDEGRYCDEYGRLYVWTAAQDACPDGWHLPSPEEFDTLLTTVGMGNGIALKMESGWNEAYPDDNSSGFSALPGGFRGNDGNYSDRGSKAFFWSNSKTPNGLSGYNLVITDNGDALIRDNYDFADGNSVRCIMNGEGFSSSSSAGFSSSSIVFYPDDDLLDDRDGQTYRTITIDTLTWMAENLNYDQEGSFCFDYEDENCERYGRLYPWESAQQACPDEWRLPSPEEFNSLIDFAGGNAVAGARLKAVEGWEAGAVSTDDYGFTALPAGRRGYYLDFTDKTQGAYFWSNSRVQNSSAAYNMDLRFDTDSAVVRDIADAHDGNSIRCVKEIYIPR